MKGYLSGDEKRLIKKRDVRIDIPWEEITLIDVNDKPFPLGDLSRFRDYELIKQYILRLADADRPEPRKVASLKPSNRVSRQYAGAPGPPNPHCQTGAVGSMICPHERHVSHRLIASVPCDPSPGQLDHRGQDHG